MHNMVLKKRILVRQLQCDNYLYVLSLTVEVLVRDRRVPQPIQRNDRFVRLLLLYCCGLLQHRARYAKRHSATQAVR